MDRSFAFINYDDNKLFTHPQSSNRNSQPIFFRFAKRSKKKNSKFQHKISISFIHHDGMMSDAYRVLIVLHESKKIVQYQPKSLITS